MTIHDAEVSDVHCHPELAAPVAPLPGPPLPTLGPESDLLIQPGCPACRYADAAGRDYLTWRTLRQGVSIGSASELVAYEDAAARHLTRFLLEVVTPEDRKGYKQHGGLCLPHLRRAALVHRKLDTAWLVRFMLLRLASPSPELDLLANWPSRGAEPTWAPAVLLGPADCLCGTHLRSAVAAAGDEAAALLAGQARLQAQRLAQVLAGSPRQRLGNFLPARARQALAEPPCPVCRASRPAS